MTITGVHPYAEKFPMLGDAELAELAESIAENGLRNPIVLTPDGLILDGRNRSAACERAGVSPTTIVYEGDDLAEYVIDCNSSRRHMSTGARAMATALVLQAAQRRKNGRWVRGSVDILAERTKRVRDDSTPTATTWRLSGRQLHFRLRLASPAVGNGRRRSTTERGHKTEPNFYRRRNNDDRHADC